ncbi:MAG: threonine dehydratase, partial [Rhodospirillales bacterium]
LRAAREVVARHLAPTPAIRWPLLAARTGAEVWVKHENHTPIGAFKIRGGLNFMHRLADERPDCPGVITATRGNHGQSVALAAALTGRSATVLVPHGNNPEKNDAMRAFGAELIEHGDDYQEAREHADGLAAEKGLYPIPPYHPWLVAGVGTYSLELLGAAPDLEAVYVPIGMGSGISGLIAAREGLGLKTEVVGVVAENAPAYALSFEAGRPVSTNSSATLADGLACRTPDPTAVEVILEGAARVVRVSEDEILAAMGHYFTDTHNVAEGAGAAPLAALMKERDRMAGRKVGLILSGGNADKALFARALERAGEKEGT